MLFWVLHVVMPIALAQGFQIGFSRWTRVPVWPAILLSAGLAALTFAPFATLFDFWFATPGDEKEATMSGVVSLLDEFLALAPPVILCWAALNALRGVRLPTAVDTRRSETSGFLRLIRPELRQDGLVDIIALSAELHYTRVYTPRGDDLVLYAFSKAMTEVGDGIQVHRSHWVSSRFVERLDRHKNGWRVCLRNGLVLPVARARRKQVADALNL